MGGESFPEWKEGFADEQQSFDFEGAGEPAYDTPKIILRALCVFPGDEGETHYENYDLRDGGDGLFYNDETGDAFERAEDGRAEIFKLKATGEFLDLRKKIQAANPSFRPDHVDELARMRIMDRKRAERRAEAETAKQKSKRKKNNF